MLTDPIANFLTRIRNATRGHRSQLTVRTSRMIRAITEVLAANNFLEGFYEEESNITLNFKPDRAPIELKRISKPGQRIYVGYRELKPVRSGLGIGLISTPGGIISTDEARKKKLGGEYLCEIY